MFLGLQISLWGLWRAGREVKNTHLAMEGGPLLDWAGTCLLTPALVFRTGKCLTPFLFILVFLVSGVGEANTQTYTVVKERLYCISNRAKWWSQTIFSGSFEAWGHLSPQFFVLQPLVVHTGPLSMAHRSVHLWIWGPWRWFRFCAPEVPVCQFLIISLQAVDEKYEVKGQKYLNIINKFCTGVNIYVVTFHHCRTETDPGTETWRCHVYINIKPYNDKITLNIINELTDSEIMHKDKKT